MYKIKKTFKFEAAHRLLELEDCHPCKNLHGHSYVVEASIEVLNISNMANPNMVIDFSNLKTFQTWLNENFDHATILNPKDELYGLLKQIDKTLKIRTMPLTGDPTAENMAKFFVDVLDSICNNTYLKNIETYTIEINVYETIGACASYKKQFTNIID